MKAGQKISLLRFSTVMLVLLILLAVLCLLSIAVGSAGYSIPEIGGCRRAAAVGNAESPG